MELKIEGPSPGGNLPACAVLRCDNEGAFMGKLITEEDGTVIESLLCVEHGAAIRSGAPWLWDKEQRVYLMGSDRTGDGRVVVTSYTVSRASTADSALGFGPVVVEATGEDGRTLTIALSGTDAAALGRDLTLFGHVGRGDLTCSATVHRGLRCGGRTALGGR